MYILYVVSEIAGIILLFSVLIVAVLYLVVSQRKNQKTEDYVTVVRDDSSVGQTNKISLLKRVPDNEYRFLIEKYIAIGYGYVPPSATYTAVSVGNVTTGGWDVQEGHYQASSVEKTDKYELYFTRRNVNAFIRKSDIICCVKEIVLTAEDTRIARSLPILNQFVVGNSLVLKHSVKSSFSKEINSSIMAGDIYAASNYAYGDMIAIQLTQEEAKAVLDFICGRIGMPNSNPVKVANKEKNSTDTTNRCRYLYKKTGNCGSPWSDCMGSPCRNPQNCKHYRDEDNI